MLKGSGGWRKDVLKLLIPELVVAQGSAARQDSCSLQKPGSLFFFLFDFFNSLFHIWNQKKSNSCILYKNSISFHLLW